MSPSKLLKIEETVIETVQSDEGRVNASREPFLLLHFEGKVTTTFASSCVTCDLQVLCHVKSKIVTLISGEEEKVTQ